MPRGDGTGPAGMGPMTGRAAGFCAGYPVPGYANPVGGRGYWGWGRGFRGGGRGRRNWYYATGLPGWTRVPYDYPALGYPTPAVAQVTPQQELDDLKQQAEYFQSALEEINEHIKQLEAKGKKQ